MILDYGVIALEMSADTLFNMNIKWGDHMLTTLYLPIYEWTIKQPDIQSVYAKLVEPKRLLFLMAVEDIASCSSKTIPNMMNCVRSNLDEAPHQLELTCLHDTLGYAKIIFTQSLEKSLDESWVLLCDKRRSETPLTYVNWVVAYTSLKAVTRDVLIEDIYHFYLSCYYLKIISCSRHFYAMKQEELSLLSPIFQALKLAPEHYHEFLLLQQDYEYQHNHKRLLGYLALFEEAVQLPAHDDVIQTCKAYILAQ